MQASPDQLLRPDGIVMVVEQVDGAPKFLG